MAYPPSVPSGARINTTPQVNTHPADHVAIHAALTDIITEMGSNPSGAYTDITARLTAEIPIGVPMVWLTASAPAGHTLLDGTAISRSANPLLFALWGTTYGVGDGSTTFNKPDFRNKFLVGAGATGFTATLNTPGGNKDLVVPDHNHTALAVADASHTHGVSIMSGGSSAEIIHRLGAYQAGSYLGGYDSNGDGVIDNTSAVNGIAIVNGGTTHTHGVNGNTGAGVSHNHAVTVNNNGVSATNANLPPFFPVNWIVRLG